MKNFLSLLPPFSRILGISLLLPVVYGEIISLVTIFTSHNTTHRAGAGLIIFTPVFLSFIWRKKISLLLAKVQEIRDIQERMKKVQEKEERLGLIEKGLGERNAALSLQTKELARNFEILKESKEKLDKMKEFLEESKNELDKREELLRERQENLEEAISQTEYAEGITSRISAGKIDPSDQAFASFRKYLPPNAESLSAAARVDDFLVFTGKMKNVVADLAEIEQVVNDFENGISLKSLKMINKATMAEVEIFS